MFFKAKSRKYREVFKVKCRENWSQQLELKQVPNTGTHILKMKEKKLIIVVTCSNVKTTASTK